MGGLIVVHLFTHIASNLYILSYCKIGIKFGEILEEEAIETGKFRVNEISRISGRGGLRAVLTPVQDFKWQGVSASAPDQNKSQAELSFMLLRGSYATVLLREIMKPENPITAGF